MHEYSLVRSLLDRIDDEARRHDAATVKRIRVRIGAQSGVETDLFTTAFDLCREGTSCERAEMEIDLVPARWSCPLCGGGIAPAAELTCASCSVPAVLASGGDLVLERIEMEVPDV